mmetsp:Transcript_1327/g.3360  ORF Transcript_1327/g.3360 Transcript_1327/m.3360 type:complete len:286 (-) Transcript_1327:452-1309(-)
MRHIRAEPESLLLVLIEHMLPDNGFQLRGSHLLHRRQELASLQQRLGLIEGDGEQVLRRVRLTETYPTLRQDVRNLLRSIGAVILLHHRDVKLVPVVTWHSHDLSCLLVCPPRCVTCDTHLDDFLQALLAKPPLCFPSLVLLPGYRDQVLALDHHVLSDACARIQLNLPAVLRKVVVDEHAPRAVEVASPIQAIQLDQVPNLERGHHQWLFSLSTAQHAAEPSSASCCLRLLGFSCSRHTGFLRLSSHLPCLLPGCRLPLLMRSLALRPRSALVCVLLRFAHSAL